MEIKEKFKQIKSETSAPDELKEAVFTTLDSITLFADIIDLFTVKYVQTEAIAFENFADGIDMNEEHITLDEDKKS